MAPSGLYARLCHTFLVYYENRTKVHNDMKEENLKKYINGIQR